MLANSWTLSKIFADDLYELFRVRAFLNAPSCGVSARDRPSGNYKGPLVPWKNFSGFLLVTAAAEFLRVLRRLVFFQLIFGLKSCDLC